MADTKPTGRKLSSVGPDSASELTLERVLTETLRIPAGGEGGFAAMPADETGGGGGGATHGFGAVWAPGNGGNGGSVLSACNRSSST
ncbi:MAG: hypothetical protein ACLGI7_18235, partial [Gammaproteobacteria bacterium]